MDKAIGAPVSFTAYKQQELTNCTAEIEDEGRKGKTKWGCGVGSKEIKQQPATN